MSYKKAAHIPPRELLEQVQEYVDGEYLYIPRVTENKKDWGSATATRQELRERNRRIYDAWLAGASVQELAESHFLSPKSIQRIITQMKKMHKNQG